MLYSDLSIIGWQFLESLALAAVDVGRIDVAEVSHLLRVLVFGLQFIDQWT